jgi:hypothetical protein
MSGSQEIRVRYGERAQSFIAKRRADIGCDNTTARQNHHCATCVEPASKVGATDACVLSGSKRIGESRVPAKLKGPAVDARLARGTLLHLAVLFA